MDYTVETFCLCKYVQSVYKH